MSSHELVANELQEGVGKARSVELFKDTSFAVVFLRVLEEQEAAKVNYSSAAGSSGSTRHLMLLCSWREST